MKRIRTFAFLAAGFLLGDLVAVAIAFRNSAGTYTLPSGNPVVSGTAITTTWANTTLADMSSELTNSLDRAGRGAMTAPLKLSSGTNSAPGIAFASETNTGLYRASAADIKFQLGGTTVQEWTPSQITFTPAVRILGGLNVPSTGTDASAISATGNGSGNGVSAVGGTTSGTGLNGTGGNPNGNGVVGTGTGTGAGVTGTGGVTGGQGGTFLGTAARSGVGGTGGSTNGTGVKGLGGATNGIGVQGLGTGTGAGVSGLGGSSNGQGVTGVGQGNESGIAGTGGSTSGKGGSFVGGVPNGPGIAAFGTGTGVGGAFVAGVSSTSSAPTDAVQFTNGNLNLDGVANPLTTTGLKNRLTPKNIVKAWAYVETAGAFGGGSLTLRDGFNVSGCAISGGVTLTCTFVTGMGSGDYAVSALLGVPSGGGAGAVPVSAYVSAQSTSDVQFQGWQVVTGSMVAIHWDASPETFSFVVLGSQ